jgi:hypothetical protein
MVDDSRVAQTTHLPDRRGQIDLFERTIRNRDRGLLVEAGDILPGLPVRGVGDSGPGLAGGAAPVSHAETAWAFLSYPLASLVDALLPYRDFTQGCAVHRQPGGTASRSS